MAAAAAATPSTAGKSVEGRCSSCCSSSSSGLRSSFVPAGGRRPCGASARKQLGLPQGGSSCVTAWFKFGDNGMDAKGAGIYGSQGRDDFDREDVAQVIVLLLLLPSSGGK